ncbi:MAG: Lrp/AsnC family transcriptional regulator [Desulfovibrionaceae bacterium]|nr:Lrp/AsnC family transcriptional regulator [Desulfovibrionaceae bacterium]
MAIALTEKERAILRIVQANIPMTLTPYADIASLCQCSEQEVLELLASLKAQGAIRRYGAMIRHQKTDWVHNAMVAWIVPEDQVESAGEIASTFANISHVYHRPSAYPSWPYNLYTMIHGRTPAECQQAIQKLQAVPYFKEHTILKSLKELKKVSMTYF